MKDKYHYIKICLITCDIVCIVLGFIFFLQIMAQKNKLLETEMLVMLEKLTEENTDLLEREKKITTDIQKFILDSKKLEEEIREAESKYKDLETKYQIKLYIDSVSTQINVVNGSNESIDRYFRVEKEELQAIVEEYDIGKEIESFPITIQESCFLLPIGEKMWLRYGTRAEDNLPFGLFIQNPKVDIGYQNARAGMFLSDIKRNYSFEEKHVSLNWENIYYLSYEDDSYWYYYMSIDSRDNPAILYIEPKH